MSEDIVTRLRQMSRLGYWPLLGDEAADTIATLRAEVEGLLSAAEDVISHVDGSLPIRGWLRDTDASREALGRLRAAIDAAKADKEGA